MYNLIIVLTYSGKEKNRTDDDQNSYLNRFYGTGTGCLELGKLGYTLNGFYLVNKEDRQPLNSGTNNQIEVVECRFHQKMQQGGTLSIK